MRAKRLQTPTAFVLFCFLTIERIFPITQIVAFYLLLSDILYWIIKLRIRRITTTSDLTNPRVKPYVMPLSTVAKWQSIKARVFPKMISSHFILSQWTWHFTKRLRFFKKVLRAILESPICVFNPSHRPATPPSDEGGGKTAGFDGGRDYNPSRSA